MKTGFVFYDARHLADLERAVAVLLQEGECDIIALGADLEFLLDARGIAYRSARSFRSISARARDLFAKEAGETFLNRPELSFFSYRDISLGRLFTPAFQYYLTLFLYYFDIALNIAAEPYERIVWYAPLSSVPAGGALSATTVRVVSDALRQACETRGIVHHALPSPFTADRSVHRRSQVFFIKRFFFAAVLRLVNVLVRVTGPRKKVRILASELWKNIASLAAALPEGEWVLLDRTEAFAIGWRRILQHRMQFVHAADFAQRPGAQMRPELAAYASAWAGRKRAILAAQPDFRGIDLEPVFAAAFHELLNNSVETLHTIDGVFEMFERLRPDLVLVRASHSAQTHFAILCAVARLRGIPSLELQHGLMSVSPETFTYARAAQFIAEYGPLDRALAQANGHAARSTLLDIGSPRFDTYVAEASRLESHTGFTVLYIAPELSPGGWSDSYEVIDLFASLAAAVSGIPETQVTIKLRPSHTNESFYREALRRAFGSTPYHVAVFESLVDLIPQADCVVSSYSTAMLEALIVGRPVVVDASLPIYASAAAADLAQHEAAGALLVTRSSAELAAALATLARDSEKRRAFGEQARLFIRTHYLFDGHSATRLADAIRGIVTTKTASSHGD